MTGFTDLSCTCCAADGINFQKTVILTSLFVYIGGYQVGFGPISWLLISEIFPLEVRGKAVSIAVVTNFFWNTLMTFFFPIELQFIGSASTFYLYAIILTSGIYFIYKKVPETKGMSLEEIEEFFMKSSQAKVLGTNPIIQRRGDYAIDKHVENYKLSPLI
jgi:MFS family permease